MVLAFRGGPGQNRLRPQETVSTPRNYYGPTQISHKGIFNDIPAPGILSAGPLSYKSFRLYTALFPDGSRYGTVFFTLAKWMF